MKRVFALTIALGLVVAISVSAEGGKAPSNKEVMQKTFKQGLFKKVTDLAKAEKWDDALTSATTMAGLAEALSKNTAKKGDADSWMQLSTEFAKNAKALATAAEKKDAEGFGTAQKAIQGSCMGCHKAHRGK
jgi:cytochrome c556